MEVAVYDPPDHLLEVVEATPVFGPRLLTCLHWGAVSTSLNQWTNTNEWDVG